MANGAEIGRFVGLRVAAVVVAVAAAVLPCPPTAVERAYSTGIYPALQSALTRLSNLTSVALVDVLAVIIGVGWTGLLARDVVTPGARWLRVAGRVAGRTLVLGAILYLLFLALWGLNYRRVPLADKLQFEAAAVSPEAARALAAATIERANALYDGAPRHRSTDAIDPPLADAFAAVLRGLGSG